MPTHKRALIAGLVAQRSEERAKLDVLLGEARSAEGGMTDEQRAEFDKGEAEIRSLDERVSELDAQVRADDAAADMAKRYAPKASGVTVTSEPEIYRSGLNGQSYFRDMWNARQNGDRDAMDRLQRNNKGRAAEQRALTTVNGAGGEFVPPLWLEKEFVRLARAGRITGNLVPTSALPAGTDSINVPKVNTGTAVAVQATQNSAVQQTDLTTTSISSTVTTIAGGQTVSLQLLEQSPLNVDDVILADLAAAYATQYNTLILSGSGSGGSPTGILTLSGTNAITYTQASPTVALLYSQIANAIQTVHTNRFLPPDTIIMHPRRWAYLLAASDTTGRPLVTPSANSPMNAVGNQGEVAAQGYVGTIQGLPVFVDAVIPTTVGGTQDQIIVARMADLMAWEGNVKAEAFPQTYANQLSVFVRLYNYMSFQPARYPKSISVISGTGLVAPTF